MSDEIEVVEQQKESNLTGAALLASFFKLSDSHIPEQPIFIPLPNIADLFDKNTLAMVGANVMRGYESDLTTMDEWSDIISKIFNFIQLFNGSCQFSLQGSLKIQPLHKIGHTDILSIEKLKANSARDTTPLTGN